MSPHRASVEYGATLGKCSSTMSKRLGTSHAQHQIQGRARLDQRATREDAATSPDGVSPLENDWRTMEVDPVGLPGHLTPRNLVPDKNDKVGPIGDDPVKNLLPIRRFDRCADRHGVRRKPNTNTEHCLALWHFAIGTENTLTLNCELRFRRVVAECFPRNTR